MAGPSVRSERADDVTVVTIDRPEVRNAIDPPTAQALAQAFRTFDSDVSTSVAVLTGAGGTFCSGFDLRAFEPEGGELSFQPGAGAPLGITRMFVSKPVIAAVEGYAVAGGLEIALWCDMRIAGERAVFGVFNRRFGIPLIDGGTIRLPRIVGQGRALDMVLTGRPVAAAEALGFGLVNRVVPDGRSLEEALSIAREIARHPQNCVRSDRRSLYEQWSLTTEEAYRNEAARGIETVRSGESQAGAARFARGQGRHGE